MTQTCAPGMLESVCVYVCVCVCGGWVCVWMDVLWVCVCVCAWVGRCMDGLVDGWIDEDG